MRLKNHVLNTSTELKDKYDRRIEKRKRKRKEREETGTHSFMVCIRKSAPGAGAFDCHCRTLRRKHLHSMSPHDFSVFHSSSSVA